MPLHQVAKRGSRREEYGEQTPASSYSREMSTEEEKPKQGLHMPNRKQGRRAASTFQVDEIKSTM